MSHETEIAELGDIDLENATSSDLLDFAESLVLAGIMAGVDLDLEAVVNYLEAVWIEGDENADKPAGLEEVYPYDPTMS